MGIANPTAYNFTVSQPQTSVRDFLELSLGFTAILTVLPATQFSGMMTPVSSLTGVAAIIGRCFPMSYFLPISLGTFTKGLTFRDLTTNLVVLAVFVLALTTLSWLLLRKQES